MEIAMHVEGDDTIDILKLLFLIFSAITLMCYLFAAFTNPGYVIGNEQVQLAKAQDYDMKHNPSRSIA